MKEKEEGEEKFGWHSNSLLSSNLEKYQKYLNEKEEGEENFGWHPNSLLLSSNLENQN